MTVSGYCSMTDKYRKIRSEVCEKILASTLKNLTTENTEEHTEEHGVLI